MTIDEKRKALQRYCDEITDCYACELFNIYSDHCLNNFTDKFYPDHEIHDLFEIVFGAEPANKPTKKSKIISLAQQNKELKAKNEQLKKEFDLLYIRFKTAKDKNCYLYAENEKLKEKLEKCRQMSLNVTNDVC